MVEKKRICNSGSKSSDKLMATGIDYLNNNKFANGIEVFKKVLNIDTNYPGLKTWMVRAYVILAEEYYSAGDLKKEKDLHKDMIKTLPPDAPLLDPGNPYKRVGKYYLDNKQYDKAIEFYKKGLKISPEDPFMHFYLTECCKLYTEEQQSHRK